MQEEKDGNVVILTSCSSDCRMVGIKHELNVNEMNSRKRQIKIVAIIVRLLMYENIIVHHPIKIRIGMGMGLFSFVLFVRIFTLKNSMS